MNYYQIMIEMHPQGVFEHDLLIGRPFLFRQIDLRALERIVHFLGNAEKIWPPLNHTPAGPDARHVNKQGQRR